MDEAGARKRLRQLGLDFDAEGKAVAADGGKGGYSLPAGDPKKMLEVSWAVTAFLYVELEKRGLKREELPDPTGAGGKGLLRSFFYASRGWKTCDRLLFLVQSTGLVFPGQWSLHVIARDGLDAGSQLPFVDRALEAGWGVAIANPNYNFVGKVAVSGSETASDHVHAAFGHLMAGSAAPFVAIVAHGHGGTSAVELSNAYHDQFDRRVESVQLVDSEHDPALNYVNCRLQQVAVNFISSDRPANGGIANKDRFTRQMSRIRRAAEENVIQLADAGESEDTKADKILREMKVANVESDGYDYRNDAIFLDIPLVSAGKKFEEWTPSSVVDHIFKRIGEARFAVDLHMEVWQK